MQMSNEDKQQLKSSIKAVREYINEVQNYKEAIKGLNQSVSEELKTIWNPIVGKDNAKALLEFIKDEEFKSRISEQSDFLDFITDTLNSKD